MKGKCRSELQPFNSGEFPEAIWSGSLSVEADMRLGGLFLPPKMSPTVKNHSQGRHEPTYSGPSSLVQCDP